MFDRLYLRNAGSYRAAVFTVDRAGPEVSKNVVKKISRPNPPGRDLRKLESVYLRIAGSTRSAVNQKESPGPWLSNGIVS